MQKKKVNNVFRLALGILASVFLFTYSTSVAEADTYTEMMNQFPGVTVSDAGTGWTTDYKLQISEKHPEGYTVYTGATSTKRELGPGEHYYEEGATGTIPISKWSVSWWGQCIHSEYYVGNEYGGFIYDRQFCGAKYSDGWLATCANCNEELHFLMYGRESTMSGITFVPADSYYVYLCPFCNNLEQGIKYQHICNSFISKNYYQMIYAANYPADSLNTGGYMADTKHMVDNATEYEGRPASQWGYTDTHLRINTYSAEGYVFIGWNTKADGTGVSYVDGDAINLCPAENKAIIVLYAQWEKKSSTLALIENGGTYYGYTGPITQDYGSTWEFDPDKITPPDGPTVTFDHNGGSGTASIQSTKSYKGYTISAPTYGQFVHNIYTFLGDGTMDTITLNYSQNSIILPTSTRSGYSFAGWYFDEACTKPVGVAGDEYTPSADITLHALWADLVLTSTDDYDSNGGKGAVDLSWTQADGKDKIYQIYQYSELDNTPKQVGNASGDGSGESSTKTFSFTGDTSKTYTVPSSGYYTLTLDGAQGGNYTDTSTGNTYAGGLGGRTTATIYLEKGEILTYNIGGQNGYNGGGEGTDYGNGGGYSIISSNLKGELLIAGGGAGATNMADGNPGGADTSLTTGRDGQDGMAGGGGGYQGGSSESSEVPGEETETVTILEQSFYDDCRFTYTKEDGGTPNFGSLAETITNEEGVKETKYMYSVYSYLGGGDATSNVQSTERIESPVMDVSDVRYLSFDVRSIGYKTFEDNGWITVGTWGNENIHKNVMFSVVDADTGNAILTRYIQKQGIAAYDSDIPHTKSTEPYALNNDCTVFIRKFDENTEEVTISGERRIMSGAGVGFDNYIVTVKLPLPDEVENIKIVAYVEYYGYNRASHSDFILGDIALTHVTEETGSAASAYGGSNYINEAHCKTHTSEIGKNTGDGRLTITMENVDYVSDNILNDVAATDMAKPDAVAEDTVEKKGINKTQYQITFDKPADHGTAYYHYVKSFDALTGTESLISNTTVNTLTTGVVRYYYIYDTGLSTGVTASASYVTGESITVTVPAAGTTKYLHIAAADKAGNLSDTIHIPIKSPEQEEDVVYEPKPNTEQIGITLGDGVATGADSRTYYVRSDGEAVIELSEYAYLTDDGSRAAAQVDTVRLNVCNTAFGLYEWSESIIPYAPDGNTCEFGNDELGTNASTQDKMILYGVAAKRYGADAVEAFHSYTIPSACSGQTLVVYPGAYTTYRHTLYASDMAADRENYINLICDGVAPVVSGLEAITGLDVINMTEEENTFTITATDDLSGLRDFYITLDNRDCAMTRTYRDEDDGVKDGVVTIVVPKYSEESFAGIEFCGDYELIAHAVDNVGNVREEESYSVAAIVTADLRRILYPHEPAFKQGESGVLTIVTQGYVERVEVVFPGEMEFDMSYLYLQDLQNVQQEALEFMIPLDFPEGDYQVIVTGYKEGTDLEQRPIILTFSVRGSVVNELRTRLR